MPREYEKEDDGEGADLAIVFGPPKGKKGMGKMMGKKKDDDGDSDMPAEYESAYAEWEKDPGPETMWRMIKACMEGDY